MNPYDQYIAEMAPVLCLDQDFLAAAAKELITAEFCFICSRATDHFAEHSDPQIVRAWNRRHGPCLHESGTSAEGRCYDCDRRVGWGRLVLIDAGLVAY
jgi:hypothetical protein